MRVRESSMPVEAQWEGYFAPQAAVERMFDRAGVDGDIVDFGCGYGTFTLAAAARGHGIVTALDIDPAMVRLTLRRAEQAGLANVRAIVRDFVSRGTGLSAASQAHAMIHNLLHIEDPLALLAEARRIVRGDGSVSVIHWRSDIATPRGPPLDIRPSPEQCDAWLRTAGFARVRTVDISDACPYHFALVAS